jgi:hypothetical protein
MSLGLKNPKRLYFLKMNARECQRVFVSETRSAIRAGLLTQRDAAILARANSRKAGYWCSALSRLRELLRERLEIERADAEQVDAVPVNPAWPWGVDK